MLINLFVLSRTPGSRQPSPAEEHLARNSFGLEQGINVGGFSQPMMQHMLNNHDQQQMGSSSFHPQHMSHHIMNGGMVQVSSRELSRQKKNQQKIVLILISRLESNGRTKSRFSSKHITTATTT